MKFSPEQVAEILKREEQELEREKLKQMFNKRLMALLKTAKSKDLHLNVKLFAHTMPEETRFHFTSYAMRV